MLDGQIPNLLQRCIGYRVRRMGADTDSDQDPCQDRVGDVADERAAPASTTTPEVPPEGIPLRDLPLSDTQRSLLGGVGIDVETFTITPAMQRCADARLGAQRMSEIIAGAAPSVVEVSRLLPCLGVD